MGLTRVWLLGFLLTLTQQCLKSQALEEPATVDPLSCSLSTLMVGVPSLCLLQWEWCRVDRVSREPGSLAQLTLHWSWAPWGSGLCVSGPTCHQAFIFTLSVMACFLTSFTGSSQH